MNGPHERDASREIFGLLDGARERYRSARATVMRTVSGALAEEADRRFVDWRFAQPGGPGMTRLSTEERRARGPESPEDLYRSYEDWDAVFRLWHERPDRWREEACGLDGELRRCVVFGSAWGPRWVYVPPETAIHDPSFSQRWPRSDPYTDLSFMLDPSEELFSYALWDDTTLRETGRTTAVAGREAVEVLAETISWGHPPSVFHGFHAPSGATDHLLLVDAEVGTLLRVAARLEGREFCVAEVVDIAYDEDFPEGTFRLELPGVEFRR